MLDKKSNKTGITSQAKNKKPVISLSRQTARSRVYYDPLVGRVNIDKIFQMLSKDGVLYPENIQGWDETLALYEFHKFDRSDRLDRLMGIDRTERAQ